MAGGGQKSRTPAQHDVAGILRRWDVPGIIVAVERDGGRIEELSHGADAAGAALTSESLAPVASITKLAAALAVLRLVDAQEVRLDDELSRHVPDAAARPGVTPRRLLSHTAGLPDDLAESAVPYAAGLDWQALARACLAALPVELPGTRVNYSNVGYGLLAILVERRTGREFSTALRDLVLDPLGIEGCLGDEPPRSPARIAGIEGDHAGTELEPFNSPFWRSLGLPWGGLVTTAAGALALMRAFVEPPADFLSRELAVEASRNQTGDLGGRLVPRLEWERCPWGLGPELRGRKPPHWMPAGVSSDTFGHAGSSGCFAWHDPLTATNCVILGTRNIGNGWWLGGAPLLGALLVS